jgi:hypothetical protein
VGLEEVRQWHQCGCFKRPPFTRTHPRVSVARALTRLYCQPPHTGAKHTAWTSVVRPQPIMLRYGFLLKYILHSLEINHIWCPATPLMSFYAPKQVPRWNRVSVFNFRQFLSGDFQVGPLRNSGISRIIRILVLGNSPKLSKTGKIQDIHRFCPEICLELSGVSGVRP